VAVIGTYEQFLSEKEEMIKQNKRRRERQARRKHRRSRRREKTETTLKARTAWVWEFSKRLVLLLALAYFIVVFYAAAIMARTGNLDALSELIQDNAEVLKVCVFGYFIKAGIENAFKIGLSKYDTPEQPADELETVEQEADNEAD
jgi:hypothetical protein